MYIHYKEYLIGIGQATKTVSVCVGKVKDIFACAHLAVILCTGMKLQAALLSKRSEQMVADTPHQSEWGCSFFHSTKQNT